MPKINVYLPDDLAETVKETGIPVSAICQRALEQAVQRLTAIRQVTATGFDPVELPARLTDLTGRLHTVIGLAADQARAESDPAVGTTLGTRHLLHGLLTEGGGLGLEVLESMDVAAEQLGSDLHRHTPSGADPAVTLGPVRLTETATAALELAAAESSALGHHYIGTEHLVVGLLAEPNGTAGQILRARGVDLRVTRRATAGALAGFLHLRSEIATGTASGQDTAAALTLAVRQELQPLLRRIEHLESVALP